MPEDLFRELTPVRTYELVVEQIAGLISSGEIAPGARLPPERELAQRFRVSRNVLREAFRVLEARGIVWSRAGGGRFVRDANISARLSPAGVVLRLENAAILDILEARELLEVQVVRLAAERTDERRGAAVLAAAEVSTGGWQANAAFHRALAAATGNFMLEHLVGLQLDLLSDIRQRAHYSQESAEAGLAEHRAIAEAVVRGDVDAAEAAMRDHLTHTRKAVADG
ncbi:FadR/GntR family transcriptional regulator [Fodinicola acaciae]|uniref:FadR/GntR family transcriptional regulator n=1 Tax=Fodinicola acaciae TaxID=2681555 RepID=UPI0013D76F01|nr:FCD domain-containing protein [Fodinicola acaciae]